MSKKEDSMWVYPVLCEPMTEETVEAHVTACHKKMEHWAEHSPDLEEVTLEDALRAVDEARTFSAFKLRDASRHLIVLADEIERLNPVISAAIKWRYQAHSKNEVDDALWAAVEALLRSRENEND